MLPLANCGGCGFLGCDAYAEAVVNEGAKANLCSVGGAFVIESDRTRVGSICILSN